ncbi:MAG: hypothetical protein JHC93_08485, partial [Parachlamydiales bacterium]|nr:hypothetical protein [Parachlamydiales bacterium]
VGDVDYKQAMVGCTKITELDNKIANYIECHWIKQQIALPSEVKNSANEYFVRSKKEAHTLDLRKHVNLMISIYRELDTLHGVSKFLCHVHNVDKIRNFLTSHCKKNLKKESDYLNVNNYNLSCLTKVKSLNPSDRKKLKVIID